MMGLYEYMPSVDDDAAVFRDAMKPRHAASSDPAVRRHNADRQRERRTINTGSEADIFRSAFED